MSTVLDKISRNAIYLKGSKELEQEERINEVILFHPISKKALFDEKSPGLHHRKWTFFSECSVSRLIFLKVQTFFFHRMRLFIPEKRITNEAKFRTVLAILLAQEELREFFLGSEARRAHF